MKKIIKLIIMAVSDRSLLLGDERGETLTAGSDVVQDVLDAAAGVHGQGAYLVVEIPSVGVKILNILKGWRQINHREAEVVPGTTDLSTARG